MNIRDIEGLKKSRVRKETGCFFCEGLRAVDEAIAGGADIEGFVATEDFAATSQWNQISVKYSSAYHKSAELILLKVGERSFGRISDTVTPQGIGAVIRMPRHSINDLPDGKAMTKASGRFGLVVLENIQDPGNLGTVLRTADAAGIYAVLLSRDTVDLYNSKVVRSAVGSMFRLPIIQTEMSGAEIAAKLRQIGYVSMAAHPRGGEGLFGAEIGKNTAVFIGNEAGGLSDELISACDRLVTIPMPGGTESLNASVAASLMIYEIRRKNS